MSFFANTETQQPAQKRKLLNISDDALNSNQQSVPVKYLAGRAYIAGDYITPAYNPKAVPITTPTAKGTPSTTSGYKYYADFALMFCTGGRRPVDACYSVIVDSDVVWTGTVVRGTAAFETITVDKYGTFNLYWGSDTQPIDTTLLSVRGVVSGLTNPLDSTTWPPNPGANVFNGLAAGDPNPYSGHYDQHPAYRGQCYAVFKDWKLGRDRTSVPNIMLELKRGCPWLNGGFIASDDTGINPIAILYDWLTDPRFGMEFPEANLLNFQTAYNALNALGARLSVLISQQSEFRQMVAQLLEYFDGWIRPNGADLEVGFWTHGTPIIVSTLTDDDLLGDPELSPQGWAPTLNEVTVVYNDRNHHFNTYSVTARDPNNRRITGMPRPITLQRPWLTDAALASKYAQEYIKIKAMPYTAGQLHVKREWLETNAMLPGMVFTYDSAFYSLAIAMRLLEIEYPADNSAKASLTVQWESAIWPSLYIAPPFPSPGGFTLGPRAIWASRITEVPYLLQDHRFVTQIVPLAVKGNVEVIGYRVWASFDNGATYQDLSNSNEFAAFGRLTLDLSSASYSLWANLYGVGSDQVVSQLPAQLSDDTLLCFIDAEVMSVGAVIAQGSGLNQIYILRGRFGTTAATHLTNAPVFFMFREALHLLDNAGFVPGATVYFKLQPFTADQDFDLTAVTPIVYVVSGWGAIAPPVFNPPSSTFDTAFSATIVGPAGTTVRYTRDGSPVLGDSPVFPVGGSASIIATTTLRARAFTANGRESAEAIATYTKVASGSSSPAPCSPPARSFTGVQGQSAGTMTLTVVTAGSTIKYSVNGGTTLTYSAPFTVNCNNTGDVIEYWAIKTGLDDSAHTVFDNTKFQTGGGGYGGGLPPHQPP